MSDDINAETTSTDSLKTAESGKPSRVWSFLMLLIKLLVPAGLIYYMINSGSLDFSKIWGMENPVYLLPIPFLMIFGLYVTTLRWRLLLQSQKISISLWNCFRLNFVSYFFSVVLPGGTGGDFLKMYYLGKWCKGYRVSAISTVVFDRIMGLVGLASLGVMAILVLLIIRPELYDDLKWVAVILGGSFLCLFFGLFALLSRGVRNLAFLKKIGPKLPFQAQVKKIVEILDKYRDNYFLLFKVWLISVLNHLVVVSFFIFIGFALPVFQDFNYFVIGETVDKTSALMQLGRTREQAEKIVKEHKEENSGNPKSVQLTWFPKELRKKLKKEAKDKGQLFKEHLFLFKGLDNKDTYSIGLVKDTETTIKLTDIQRIEHDILFNITDIPIGENGQPVSGTLDIQAIFSNFGSRRNLPPLPPIFVYQGQITILEHNPLPWWLFIVYVPLGMEINAIPISPGGLGVGESAFESLIALTLDNKNLSLGAEMMLIWRILFALSSLPGIFFWGALKKGIEMEKAYSGVEVPEK